MRTADGTGWRFHPDLNETLIRTLNGFCQREPASGSIEDPVLQRDVMTLLSDGSARGALWHGPVYAFPDRLESQASVAVIRISEANGHLLKKGMGDWLPDVAHRTPFIAAIVDDQAVAVCASVRMGQWIHEAGVETQPAYRRSGLGRVVVSAWAEAVRSLGVRPVYSTSRGN